MAQSKTDPRRKVVEPSPADRATAQCAFDAVAVEWAAMSPRNHDLLALVRSDIAEFRSAKERRQ